VVRRRADCVIGKVTATATSPIAHARCPVCNPRPQPLSANQPQIPYDHIFERWGIAPDFRYWQFCDMARGKDALSPGADISALVRMKPVYAFTA